jgi:glycosyltransferase involved in cell wall biosynthesis
MSRDERVRTMGYRLSMSNRPDRPTVVRMITRLNIGGPARQALILTKALRDEYRTVLAVGKASRSESQLSDPEVDVVPVPLVRNPSPLKDIRSVAAAKRLFKQLQPKIVHTHMAKAGTVGRLAALRSNPRPKLVHTFHGHVLDAYFGPVMQRMAISTERWLALRTDVLVTVSEEIKEQLLTLGIGRPDQYRVIPVGIDLSRHADVTGPAGDLRRQIGVSPECPLIGIIGRLAPIKDHVTLLTAMVDVPGAHLAVIGDGGMRRGLRRLSSQLGLADRVHFTGWIEDMPAAISDLDLVVLTSANEGTPVALIEALACGRPVVSTPVGGVPSVIQEGKTGYLTPSRSPADISKTLNQVLASLPEATQMAQKARTVILERFTQDRLILDVRALYKELLG